MTAAAGAETAGLAEAVAAPDADDAATAAPDPPTVADDAATVPEPPAAADEAATVPNVPAAADDAAIAPDVSTAADDAAIAPDVPTAADAPVLADAAADKADCLTLMVGSGAPTTGWSTYSPGAIGLACIADGLICRPKGAGLRSPAEGSGPNIW